MTGTRVMTMSRHTTLISLCCASSGDCCGMREVPQKHRAENVIYLLLYLARRAHIRGDNYHFRVLTAERLVYYVNQSPTTQAQTGV